MNKGKILGMIIGIMLFTVTVAGFTYAYITWRSGEINKVVNSDCFIINYEKGSNINNAKLSALDETNFIERPYMTVVEGMSLTNINLEIDSACNTSGVGAIKINMTTLSDAFTTGDSIDSLKYIIVENSGSIDMTIEDVIGEKFQILKEGTINKLGETTLTTVNMRPGNKHQLSVIFYLDDELVSNDAVSGVISGEISAEVTQRS